MKVQARKIGPKVSKPTTYASLADLRLECMELQSLLQSLRQDNRYQQKIVEPQSVLKLNDDLKNLKQEYFALELQRNLDKLV